MDNLEKIGSIHPDVIDEFIRTGKSTVIPPELQRIINQMVYAMQIWSTERNITRAAKRLQVRTKAEQGVEININTAKSRIYAALNYFDVDCNVPENVWLRDYANKFEDLVKVALAKGRVDIAERCMDKAKECRLQATAADKQASLGVVYVMSNEITPEDLGFTSRSKKEIARKANDGLYARIIDSLDIPEVEKKRLREDAEIEDVPFTELQNEMDDDQR